MELAWLKYFVETARTGNMTKAAENLYISQPALSKTIGMLEKELGIALFERTGRGLKLNQYGREYYERTNKVLEELEDARRRIQDAAGKPDMNVRLTLAAFSPACIDLIVRFRQENPDIQ